jgi:D-alanyl-D-alanine carboxypeptidase (penicillin-binding protein 5/6)
VFASDHRFRCSRRRLGAVALAVTASIILIQAAPAQDTRQAPIGAYLVVDAHSKKVLMAAQATKRRPVASLTKIATVCVVLDWADATQADLGQLAQVPPSAAGLQPNPFGFQPGDTISLRNAMCCAMMGSDNIAAETLAWHVGADLMRRTGKGRDPLSVFVKQMNALADRLAMDDTRFLNPHGLDTSRPAPYSTAADLARLTLYALQKPTFAFYTSQPERKVAFFKGGTERQTFLLKNTNELVGRNGIDGVKTGTTARAGECLILTASKKSTVVKIAEDNHQVFPRRLVAVLLAAHDRFRQGASLLDQGWSRHEQWSAAGRPIHDPSELLDPVAQ